jgi:hypothetical protein
MELRVYNDPAVAATLHQANLDALNMAPTWDYHAQPSMKKIAVGLRYTLSTQPIKVMVHQAKPSVRKGGYLPLAIRAAVGEI